MDAVTSKRSGSQANADNLEAKNDSLLWFLTKFVVLLALAQVIFTTWVVDSGVLEGYLAADAWAAAGVLRLLGFEAASSGTLLETGGDVIRIERGCDGIQPAGMFAIGVLVFPAASWRWKLIGAVVGVLALLVLNVVRIVSLVLIGKSFPSFFATAHLTAWPMFFIVVATLQLIVWARTALSSAHRVR